jgi:hypothetical protein
MISIPHFFFVADRNMGLIKDLKKKFPNDQELGRELRKFLDSSESNPPAPYTIELDQPINQTTLVVRDAMKAVAKDVLAPKVVREGKVKPKKK